MAKANSFIFYESYFNSADSLKDDKAFRELISAFCKYGLFGEIIDFQIDYVEGMFYANKVNIDYSIERRKTNKENGEKGGAPFGNQNAKKKSETTENNRKQPNNNLNENENVNDNLNKNINDNSNVNENLNGKVDVNANANGFSRLDASSAIKSISEKKKRLSRNKSAKDLSPSELQEIFPDEDIQHVVDYYDRLKLNHFMGFEHKGDISAIDELKDDYYLVKAEEKNNE